MDIGAAGATVALAKAVVVHAVLLGLLLLLGLPDDGQAALDRAAGSEKHSASQPGGVVYWLSSHIPRERFNSLDSCRSTCAVVIDGDSAVAAG